MTGWDPSTVDLVTLLSRSVRGPRREGIYALWLTLRVAEGLRLAPPLGERSTRRRLAGLERRLSSLTVPPPLRRALTAALAQLRDAPPEGVPGILASLVAPARESAGAEAAEALQRAVRAARQAATPSHAGG
jgi:hypothetical protein